MQATFLLCFLILSAKRSYATEKTHQTDAQFNFEWTRLQRAASGESETILHDSHLFYKIRSMPNTKRHARSISDAVVETTRCEHIELMDCDHYDSDEMTCMITATGFPCCVCNGKLKIRKRAWSLW